MLDVVDFIFPKYCYGCGIEGEWLCQKCRDANIIEQVADQVCPICKLKNKLGAICEVCKSGNDAWMKGMLVALNNTEIAKKMIFDYKYNGVFTLSDLWSDFMLDCLKKNNVYPDVIVGIPIEIKRKWWRGYDQVELIAKKLSVALKVEYKVLLQRTKYHRPQVGLEKRQRVENIRDSICLNKDVVLPDLDAKIMIIDDVCTTGATLNECARLLKNNGFSNIYSMVLTRGI